MDAFSTTAPIPIKAMTSAFLYNFLLFTDWEKESENDITICIAQDNSLGNSLYDLRGKQVKNQKIEVEVIQAEDSFSNCELLFIPEKIGEKQISEIVNRLEGRSILTVSDSPHAIEANVMIALFVQAQRLAFIINKNKADHAGIKLSSKLLRLATRVIE
jgi:hypothetical protein